MQTWKTQLWDNVARTGALCLFLCFVFPASSLAGPPPVITVQPLDQTVVYGGTANFTVAATSGTALSYQWYKRELVLILWVDTELTGQTSSTLAITDVGNSDDGIYFVKVTNAGGTVASRYADLNAVANTPPVANNNNYTTLEDVPLIIPPSGILTNDTDINGQTLTAVLVTDVTQGSLSLNPNGSFNYTPPSNYFGSVSFAYRASDGYHVLLEQNNSGGDAIQINPGDTGAQSFRQGSAGGSSYMISKVVLYVSRSAGGSGNLNFSIGTGINASAIAGSAVAIPTSSLSNTSDGNSFQTYAIVYPAPIGPFAAGTTYYLNLDNQTSEKIYVETPASNTYGNGTYYDRGSNQSKDMRFQIYETIVSNPATVTINVTPVNDTPVANNDSTNTLEDVSVTINVLLNDSDPDVTPLTIISTSTTNGTAVINGNQIDFTPATNFNGTVVFSYIVSDGANSATGSVFVAVASVNDAPPVANPDVYTTAEDVPLTVSGPGILLSDMDEDGDTFTALLVSNVSHGSLSLNANGGFIYSPNANFNGSDSFTYYATDGLATGAVATVTINVTPVNDAPVSAGDTYTTLEDVPLIVPAAGILSNDTDVETNGLTAWLVSDVSNGTLNLNTNGSFTYTPDENYNGTDSFTYRARDGVYPILQENTSGGSGIDVKEAKKGAQSFRHGTAGAPSYTISKIVLYLSRDATAPNRNLTVTIGTGTNSGAMSGSSVAINPSSITNTSSGASFQRYEIVYAKPVGPLAAGTTYYLNLECEAPNGRKIYTDSAGSSTYANGTYYDAGADTGKDMKFAICDSITSETATVTINITAVNDRPEASNDSTNTLEDVSVTIPVLADDSDVEGTPLTITSTSTTNGTAVISGTAIVFTPATNFNGLVVFNYTVSDGTDSDTARVTVTVIPVNDAPPVAYNDTYSSPEDTTLTVPAPGAGILANDTDVDGNTLTALLVSDVSHGTLALNADGSFTYTPVAEYNGPDSFTYRAADGSTTSNVATVNINVTPVSDPLKFTSQQMTAAGFELHVAGDVSAYVISASSNLVDWTPIFTNAAPTGPIVHTDTAAPNYPYRFYRVETR